MQIIWADRIAIVWASFLNLIFFMIWAPQGLPVYLHELFGEPWLKILFFAVVPLWLFLRFASWAFTSPKRRVT